MSNATTPAVVRDGLVARTRNFPAMSRAFNVSDLDVDEEGRRARFSFSSEEPAEQPFGIEILEHSEAAVDFSRLRASAPVLVQHDEGRQVGVVEEAGLDGKRTRVATRFSKVGEAPDIFADVLDGIRRNVSTKYIIREMFQESAGDPTRGIPPTYRITKWTPVEVSVVSVPADHTVGFGRAPSDRVSFPCEVFEMSDQNDTQATAPAPAQPVQPAAVITARDVEDASRTAGQSAMEAERARVVELQELGNTYNGADLAQRCIAEGRSADEMRAMLLERQGKITAASESPALGIEKKEIRRYSLLRAISALCNPLNERIQRAAGFEREVSAAGCQATGRESQGLFIPYDILAERGFIGQGSREVTVGGSGGNLVATDLDAASFIDLLRNRMVIMQMGARRITGLVGDYAVPRQTGGATVYWVGESGAPTPSDQVYDQVPMTPHTIGCVTDVSRRAMLQTTPDAEDLAREDLVASVATGLDLAGMYGTGASNQPTGIVNQTGINVKAFAAADPTFPELVDQETLVAADNADIGNLGYVTDAAGRGYGKSTLKSAGVAGYIWEGNEVNGYRALASQQVTAGDWIFGNWRDLLVGMWSGIDLMADPYKNSDQGAVRVIALQDVDIAVRHPVSFCLGNGP